MGLIDITVVSSATELDRHAAAWNRLAARSPQCAPMLSYPWIATYVEHRLREREAWCCVLAYEGDELVGALPLVHSTRRAGPLAYQALRAPHDNHTISVGPLVASGRSHEVIEHLLAAARKHYPRHFRIELKRLPASSPIWTLTQTPAHRMLAIRRFRGVGAYLPVPEDFAAFRAGLSRNFRNNLNKAGNKLRKRGQVSVEFLTGADATASDLPRFMRVEAANWKGERGTAIQSSPELVRFYTALVQRLSQAGWLEWHFLEADGVTLAANFAVRLGRVLLLWKLGYDQAYRRLSPGSLLMERLIERCAADPSVAEINLMTDQPWYDNWQMQKRACYDLDLYPWQPGPLVLGYGAARVRELARGFPLAERAIAKLKTLGPIQAARAPE
ncbi:MAG: hypothetical protein Tsb0020_49670 [Haliangiales bacterium]